MRWHTLMESFTFTKGCQNILKDIAIKQNARFFFFLKVKDHASAVALYAELHTFVSPMCPVKSRLDI